MPSGVFIGDTNGLAVVLEKAHLQAFDFLSGGSTGNHEFLRFVSVFKYSSSGPQSTTPRENSSTLSRVK